LEVKVWGKGTQREIRTSTELSLFKGKTEELPEGFVE